jgi:hypothetical protein
MYLISKRGRIAHIWDGKDTACRMASTGGLKLEKCRAVDEIGERAICQMCQQSAIDRPEARLMITPDLISRFDDGCMTGADKEAIGGVLREIAGLSRCG